MQLSPTAPEFTMRPRLLTQLSALFAFAALCNPVAFAQTATIAKTETATATTAAASNASFDPMAFGAALTAAFYAKQFDAIWPRLSPTLQAAFKTSTALARFREQVSAQVGQELSVISETVEPIPGAQVYQRRVKFSQFGGVILVQWAFDAEQRVAGFQIVPDPAGKAQPTAATSPYLDRPTKTLLRLPFEDEFYVVWGGRTIAQNYHAAHANQRFAMDAVILKDGRTHARGGRRNEDYFCFGKRLLAPGSGKVSQVQDGIADNVPREMNRNQILGNHVIIDHGNGEYSLLAHFRQGSIQVKKGDTVKTGDWLGECGNSGNSSEPHLHYHLQDGPDFGQSRGMPAQFNDYLANGQPVQRGEPSQAQSIRPAR